MKVKKTKVKAGPPGGGVP